MAVIHLPGNNADKCRSRQVTPPSNDDIKLKDTDGERDEEDKKDIMNSYISSVNETIFKSWVAEELAAPKTTDEQKNHEEQKTEDVCNRDAMRYRQWIKIRDCVFLKLHLMFSLPTKNINGNIIFICMLLILGANGEKYEEPVYRPFQSIPCLNNEVLPVTDPDEISPGSFYLIVWKDPLEKITCSSQYIQDNWNCSITVGNVNRSQCDGFQLAENNSTIHINLHCGSIKTSQVACIFQKSPEGFKVFPLGIYVKDQDNTKLNGWMLAFCIGAILLAIGFMIWKRDHIKSIFTGLKEKIPTQWSRISGNASQSHEIPA